MENAYQHDVQAVLGKLGVDPETGLSEREVEAKRKIHGRNELPAPEMTSFWTLVLKQFEDQLVLILLGAAVVSFVLAFFEEGGEDQLTAFVEPAVILIILAANATVGVVQETNAEKSIEALKKSEARESTVIRDGRPQTINAVLLVPGDIVHVEVGDKVPADCRLLSIETATLSVDEAMLTGESVPAQKHTDAIHKPDAVDADKRNCLFSGTLVVRGKATAVVCQTGAATSMGRIAEGLQKNDDDEKTPLQEKLDEFGEQLSKVILVICIAVWAINIGHFTDEHHGGLIKGAIYYFKIAVALAVAAIPEGLPAVVTTCLALGTHKMAKKNAIVRSLPSVETLGCTTVICSDKTGTLTTNKMSVQRVITFAEAAKHAITSRIFDVEGDSFAPFGRVVDDSTKQELLLPAAQDAMLGEVSKISSLCNEANLTFQYADADDDKKSDDGGVIYDKTGTPTEAAIRVLAEKICVPDEREARSIMGSDNPAVRVNAAAKYWDARFERQHLMEFSRDRKSMSVLVAERSSGRHYLYCKGATENVLSRCTHVIASSTPGGRPVALTNAMREEILRQNEGMAAQGLRCLALARIEEPSLNQDWKNLDHYADIESGMTLVGIVCMLDPPRKAVPQSIQTCYQAGIRVIVITGDNKVTAESICRRIGVFQADENLAGKSYTGAEFERLSEHKQREVVGTANLFSRVEPRHKSRLVELLKDSGEVVAMTGDGVNDAPALREANIGVAMGSGTDVAREASDMVLQDDNFATIVMAVEEGRAIYANTKQFIRYLISSNIGEVACIFLAAAIGMPEALIPVQLLWVNLVTDGLPATALGFNPPDSDIMRRPPRSSDERIINGWMFFRYMAIGVYVGVATVGGFIWYYLMYADGPLITYTQLTTFHQCDAAHTAEAAAAFFGGRTDIDCGIFDGVHLATASTVALSILVTIEMFNALNALSENQSLLVVTPFSNIWVVLAVIMSFALHFMILYVPFFQDIFRVFPINFECWKAVIYWSFPVFLLDEVLKIITRNVQSLREAGRVSRISATLPDHYQQMFRSQVPLTSIQISGSPRKAPRSNNFSYSALSLNEADKSQTTSSTTTTTSTTSTSAASPHHRTSATIRQASRKHLQQQQSRSAVEQHPLPPLGFLGRTSVGADKRQ